MLTTEVHASSATAEVDPGMTLLPASASVGDAPASASARSLSGSEYEINDVRLRAGFLPNLVAAGGYGGNWDHNLSIGVLAMRAR